MSFRRKLSFRRSNSGKCTPTAVEFKKGDAAGIDILTLQPAITESTDVREITETNITACVIKENVEVEGDFEVIDTKKEDIKPATSSQNAP